MSDNGRGRPQLTVGSLRGVPLGSSVSRTERETMTGAPPAGAVVSAEGPWTIAAGDRGPGGTTAPFRTDGVEALTYDNVFGQDIEQVWFDGKLVYALDLGEVDIDPAQVQVAQEYQVVYAVDLDEHGRQQSMPERVPGQLNIYDSIPGMATYSPIWQFNYVVVPRDYHSNTLRSEGDCLASGYPIQRSQMFEN